MDPKVVERRNDGDGINLIGFLVFVVGGAVIGGLGGFVVGSIYGSGGWGVLAGAIGGAIVGFFIWLSDQL